jgi:hypothetical protein
MKVCDVIILVRLLDVPTVWSRVVVEEITVFQLVKYYTIFYDPWKFITSFPSIYF